MSAIIQNLTVTTFMSKPVQPIPNKSVYEEGGVGVSSKLELFNGIFCETPRFEKVTYRRKEPSLEKWISFRYLLDQINAWKWQPSYSIKNILGGAMVIH